MKTLFCIFLSIFALGNMANATSYIDEYGYDAEIDKIFSSSTTTSLSNPSASQTTTQNYLSTNLTAIETRLNRIKPAAAERKKSRKRHHDEITQPNLLLPSLDVFDRISTAAVTMPYDPCPPTPKAGHYELRDRDGQAVYWKKEYNLHGILIGFE